MTSKKPDWFELADADESIPRPPKAKRKFPLLAAASLGVVVLSGSLLINTNEEPSANASIPNATSQQIATTTGAPAGSTQGSINKVSPTTSKVPLIAPVKKGKSAQANSNRREEGEHREGGERESGENDD